jgi:hypothetical protein
VIKEVASLRSKNIKQTDSVPHRTPKLDSYCGL